MVIPNKVLEAIRQQVETGLYSEAARACLELLRQDPGHVEVNLIYGDLAIKMRRPQDAIVIFRKLLAANPHSATAHDRLSYLHHLTGDYASAREHANTALALDASLVESQLVLGAIAATEGNRAEALRAFKRLRKALPGEIHIEKAYLDALMTIGEFSQVQVLARELLQQHSRDAYLYLLLAKTHTLTADDPDKLLIQALGDGKGGLSQEFQNTEDQIRAYMALFKLHSDLGELHLAFNYLSGAKTIRKQQFNYDPASDSEQARQLREVFNPAVFSGDIAGASADEPIFIVGMPRSGTTLLERVLCSDPQVAAAGELTVVGQLVQLACARMGQNQYDLQALKNLTPDLWRQLGEQYVIRARRQVGDTPVFIDKMPGNYQNIGFILAMLPGARIIHLSRHPVANCLSIYEQDFEEGQPWTNDLNWLGQHYLEYRRCMDYWQDLLGERIIEVTYESLVSDTQATLEQLAEKLALNLTGDNIKSAQREGHIITASQWQARQPIHSQSIARWQHLQQELEPLIQELEPVIESGQIS